MKPCLRSRVVVSTAALGLLAACGPAVPVVEGETEGSTGASTGGTSNNPDPTRPMTTTPDPSVGSGEVTGDPDTTGSPTTSGPDDTTTGGSGGEGCCEVHDTPGCTEEAVVECVCAQEAFCCAFEWDQNCVDLAMADCMATCEDPGTTGDEDSSSGEPAGACSELVQIEMLPADATHSGAWGLSPSQVLPYEISLLDEQMGTDGSILYEPEIPCDATWYVWVLYWEQGSEDSYFATLDGEPMPEAIFEGDCEQFGQGYSWRLLNWRDQAAMACDYVADPWAPDWTAGVHQIEFSYRESPAMGQILITNDELFVPPHP
jgi:hypothetical protein